MQPEAELWVSFLGGPSLQQCTGFNQLLEGGGKQVTARGGKSDGFLLV